MTTRRGLMPRWTGSAKALPSGLTVGALVTRVKFMPASFEQRQLGLLGWVAFTLSGSLRVSAALRRTRTGLVAIAYPEKTDHRGRRHAIVRPATKRARRTIEQQVFDAVAEELETLGLSLAGRNSCSRRPRRMQLNTGSAPPPEERSGRGSPGMNERNGDVGR